MPHKNRELAATLLSGLDLGASVAEEDTIDTQRLSLVWLRLIPTDEILELEAALIGSREIRGQQREVLHEELDANTAELPTREIKFCRKLQRSLRPGDGFRRQAVPVLLYRYFAAMAQAFGAVRRVVRKGGPFALIVGHNHTILGGQRFISIRRLTL